MLTSDVRDTLIDCMTSFGIHGHAAAEASDYILSPESGLVVLAESVANAPSPTRTDAGE